MKLQPVSLALYKDWKQEETVSVTLSKVYKLYLPASIKLNSLSNVKMICIIKNTNEKQHFYEGFCASISEVARYLRRLQLPVKKLEAWLADFSVGIHVRHESFTFSSNPEQQGK